MTLSSRIEAASGPDRELDVAIFRIVKPEYASPLFKLYGTGMRHVNDSSDARCMPEPKATVPYYTASIDAALTLVPEGWGRRVIVPLGGGNVSVEMWADPADGGPLERITASASTEALALAAAAIKIKESERADNG